MSATPTAVPNLVQIRPRGASGRNITKIFLFIPRICLFSRHLYRSDQSTDFHDDGSNDAESHKGVTFGVR